MSKEYKIIAAEHYGVALKEYENYDDDWMFCEGDSILNEAPNPLIAHISKNPVNIPENNAVHDFVWGIGAGLKISKRAKELLENEEGVHAEYVPLTIIDVKGKELEEEFFVVNPLEKHEAIDLDKSTVEMNSLDEDSILGTHDTRLVLKKSGDFEKFDLIIPEHLNSELMMSTDLIKKIQDAGFTNLKVNEPSEYRG